MAPPSFLEFCPAHARGVRDLIAFLVGIAPGKRILFTSDWQFGPQWTRRFLPMRLDEFWRIHDAQALLLNAAYWIANDLESERTSAPTP